MTVHRIWDFRGDQAGIVWFRKQTDGSVEVVRRCLDTAQPLAAYAHFVHAAGVDPGSIDYVRADTKCASFAGPSLFDAMGSMGLNPEVLHAELWRLPQPSAQAAA